MNFRVFLSLSLSLSSIFRPVCTHLCMFMLANNVDGQPSVYPHRYVLFMSIYLCDICLCLCLSTCVLFHMYICAEDCGEEGFFKRHDSYLQVCYLIFKNYVTLLESIFTKLFVNKLKCIYIENTLIISLSRECQVVTM